MSLPITLLVLVLAYAGAILTTRIVRPFSGNDCFWGGLVAFVLAVAVFTVINFPNQNDPQALVYGAATAFIAAPFMCAIACGVRHIRQRILDHINLSRL